MSEGVGEGRATSARLHGEISATEIMWSTMGWDGRQKEEKKKVLLSYGSLQGYMYSAGQSIPGPTPGNRIFIDSGLLDRYKQRTTSSG
jgi:hypothetical protein